MFYGDIRSNVAYAREATDDEIHKALEIAGAWEFVSQLSDGIDTMVGDRGVMLSEDSVPESHSPEPCSRIPIY